MTTNSNYTVLAKTDISQSTISGIMSLKAGKLPDDDPATTGKMNIMSAAAMDIFAETTLDSSSGTVHTIRSGQTRVIDVITNTPTATNSVKINP
jgi:hypothetical protein